MTWLEVCEDRQLRDLPYKIELNRWGKIEMSPTRGSHVILQARIQRLLSQLLPDGEALPECPIKTSENVKVADVGWCSSKRLAKIKNQVAFSIAPEICVEILSDSNTVHEMTTKRSLYFQADALEFWLCDKRGRIRFYNANGPLKHSALCPDFPGKVEI